MSISVRLIVLLVTAITLVVVVTTWTQVRAEELALRVDLQQRASIAAERLREALAPVSWSVSGGLVALIERLAARERLDGVAVYDGHNEPLAVSAALSRASEGHKPVGPACDDADLECGEFIALGGRPLYAYSTPLYRNSTSGLRLTVLLDAGAIAGASDRLWRRALWFMIPQIVFVVLITYFVMQSAVLAPIARTARWMRDLRFGDGTVPAAKRHGGLLASISSEAMDLAQGLLSAQASAETEARLREAADSLWTPERLRVGMRERLVGTRLFVVSNREPYEHVRRGKAIEVLVPASGVVTALEPVLCACDGTWIAHGSGDADRDVVDDGCRVRVPPNHARYTLRRVWLTPEEETGYYFGFANEGLWPLCHIAHTRPIFRVADWDYYRTVNQKFAQAVLDEMQAVEQPVLLVQDYHFALLPQLVKQARPDARVAMFWHIPWPNPEAFEICPWQSELLDGMLGADLIGFHIQAHCHNFLETIDRCFECRIEWERFAVRRHQHPTVVRPHPISVAFPENAPDALNDRPVASRADVRRRFHGSVFLGLGVDRIDYTKGILERFLGVERFLDKYPQYRERFTFVQLGAPSRTRIKRYQDFLAEVRTEADRINRRLSVNSWRPIHLLDKQHTHREIAELYRTVDVCLVTSLHDGMNLVAKEYVASRDDDDGVLVLSQFTGASRELRDALRVNPYDIEQLADAIRVAVEMSPEERRTRMRHMRRTVRNNNVYRWAADLISELAEIRPEAPDVTLTR